jgi:hypothetical protein
MTEYFDSFKAFMQFLMETPGRVMAYFGNAAVKYAA